MSGPARVDRVLPLLVAGAIIAGGWVFLLRPLSQRFADAEARIDALGQQEAAWTARLDEAEVTTPAVGPGLGDLVAAGDPTVALIERLARLASEARLRELVIETVEGPDTGEAASNPRLALFDEPITDTTLRTEFEGDYADVGQFLWSLRDLPTVVSIDALRLRPIVPPPAVPSGRVRASVTLRAYHRADAGSPSRDVAAGAAAVPALADVALDRQPRWGRNPFASPARRPGSSPAVLVVDEEVVLASILHSPARRLAIVNGRIVRVGDRVGAATVVDIETHRVVLSLPGGGRRTVELQPTAAREP